jgi:superfamily II DNA or RNA helicase/HKD family nuclease
VLTVSADRPLPPGVYDAPITHEIVARLASHDEPLREIEALDPSESPRALARLVQARMIHALAAFPTSREDALERQLDLTNQVLSLLEGVHASGASAADHLAPPGRRLLAVRTPAVGLGVPISPPRPEIPLSSSDLLVNGRHDVSLGPEVKREIASADRVDLLCSFLKWSGFRLVEEALADLTRRRPGSLRVLTTAYMSATDRRALDALRDLGAEVRVSYDVTRTRLHAKAWLFHRESGFSTACVGSSNLSAAAMLDGLEWNVRLSEIDNRPILEKFRTTFEQYWDDPEFRPYVAEEFDQAIDAQRAATKQYLFLFDVEPRPHQREILEQLQAERAKGHFKNLVVAATGTGKTVVAALDYKSLSRTAGPESPRPGTGRGLGEGPRPPLLFVAHRREILEQSRATFEVVVRDPSWHGELHVGDERPVRGQHVFASIQSLSADRIAALAPDAFDVVIVDEFHHAAAESYERLLAHLRPRVLLGLTATPERTDGRSILQYFDGRIASELRLWKALDQQLLSPFQYFGVGGAPGLSAVPWSAGHYDTARVSNLYTADDYFARLVLRETQKRVRDAGAMRALGFCVDIAHATFMARKFTEAGLPSAVVSALTSKTERERALGELRAGSLRAIFSVDLFNEGVDVPDVDTVLFLRPTESATVFLQQLGRGLRKTATKDCLTVLDFIGDAHRRFRFDLRYRAIVGGTRRSIRTEIERGFPSLPSGCVIQLDRQSQEAVLKNIDHALGLGKRALVEDLKSLAAAHGDIDLATFLRETECDPSDLYGNDWTWSRLRREAGLDPRVDLTDEDAQVERALSRMLHIDDAGRLDGLRAIVNRETSPVADPSDAMHRALFVLLGWVRSPYAEMARAWAHLWSRPWLRSEVSQLLAVLSDRSRWLGTTLGGPLGDVPLAVHGTFTLDEILAAFDERNAKGGVKRIQTGVFHLEARKSDLLFVTLEKSEKHYTPTTLYDDYPISPTRFHWESQSTCHEDAPAGRRYMAARSSASDGAAAPTKDRAAVPPTWQDGASVPSPRSGERARVRGRSEAIELPDSSRTDPAPPGNVVLFVRQRRSDDRGETMPYLCLGRVFYREHRGGRPMQIEWELETAMPSWWYQETKRAAG